MLDNIPENKRYLFFKDGKPKKTYCRCLSREQISMFKKLYGREIIQCAGSSCPFYSVSCGRELLKIYRSNKE